MVPTGLIFFFLSLKLLLERRLGMQHWIDLKDLTLKFPLGVLSLLCKLDALGVAEPDVCSSSLWSFRKLSLKRSDNLCFLSVGDGSGLSLGVRSAPPVLLTLGAPAEKLWCTGVLPRDGVNSALWIVNNRQH